MTLVWSHYAIDCGGALSEVKKKWKPLYTVMEFNTTVMEVLTQLYGNIQSCFCCYIGLHYTILDIHLNIMQSNITTTHIVA